MMVFSGGGGGVLAGVMVLVMIRFESCVGEVFEFWLRL